MLENLKEKVYRANMELVEKKLVIYTWGNASGIDREKDLVVIKPSGIKYEALNPEDLVVTDIQGNIVEGHYNPSSDLHTHLELYKNFESIGGVVHTHALWSTAWAQAGINLPCLGTTHADHFLGEIPCTRKLSENEIVGDYVRNTGKVIVETFRNNDYQSLPGILVNNHGPFTWGEDAIEAAKNAVVLEEIAKINYSTLTLNPNIREINQVLLEKHYFRKHGKNAYYGQ